MNNNIVPLRLRPHLVSFAMKEMTGETVNFTNVKCKAVDIPRKSYLGKFLLEHLEKINYPVKDIASFNFFANIRTTERRRFVVEGYFWKKERLGNTFVYLPEKYMDDVNDIFENMYRNAFFNFVESRNQDNELLVSQCIIDWIDRYDLFECGINQSQLHRLYYRLKKKGILSCLHGKLYRD